MRRVLLVVVVLCCAWGGVVSVATAYTITLRGPSAVPDITNPPWTGSLYITVTVDSALPFCLHGTDLPNFLQWFPGSTSPTVIAATLTPRSPSLSGDYTVTAEIENGGPDNTHPEIQAVISMDPYKPGVVASVRPLKLTTRSHIVAGYWAYDASSHHTRVWAVMKNASGRTVARTAKTDWRYRGLGSGWNDYAQRPMPLHSSRASGTFVKGLYHITMYAEDYGGNIGKDVVTFRVK